MTKSSSMINASAQTAAADPSLLGQIKFWAFCTTIVGAAFSNSLASAGSVAYVLALIVGAIRKDRPLPVFPFAALAITLSVSVLISAAVSDYPMASRQGLLKFTWSMILLYAGADAVRTRSQLRAAIAVLLVCETAAALSGIGQDLWGWDWIRGRAPVLYTEAITRVTGPFKHCNDFGTFLIPGWVIGSSVFFDRIRTRRAAQTVAAFVFLMLIGWVMFRTMSRSAMMGAVAGTCVLAFTLPYRRKILAVVIAAVMAAWWVPSPFASRLHRLLDFGDGGMQERIYLLKGALKMIHAAPWFGLGLNTYSEWFPIYNPPDSAHPVVMYSHNSFMQMATEVGWVGLTLYLLLVFAVLARAARPLFEKREDEWSLIRAGVWASLIGILVNALFESLLQSTQLRTFFWSLMGLSLAMARSGWEKPHKA